MTTLQAALIRSFALWTVFVWATRIRNVFDDPARDLAFKLVHSGLALVSVGFAVAALLVVRSVRRGARVAYVEEVASD